MGTRAAALIAALACSWAATMPAWGQAVPTVTVASTSERQALAIEGHVEAVQQSVVSAQVGGNVVALLVQAGDRVRAGQLLVRVDEREVQAGLLRGEAGVAQADAEMRLARTNVERTRELRNQGFVSAAALDQAETQLRAAQAQTQQADAARAQARLLRGFAAATAPFDGLVLATHVQAGDLATPGRPLLTVYRPGAMRAVVHVPASLAATARGAERADVGLPDGRWQAATQRVELPAADAVSQTVEWRLELPAAAAGALRPGQAVPVRFVGAKAAAAGTAASAAPRLVVPASSVLRRGELTAVYVAADKAFVLRPVRLGRELGEDRVEVLAGLRAGERIARDGVRAGLAGAVPQR